MKKGTLVAYGWKHDKEEYISDPEKYGITITDPMWHAETTAEVLVREGEDWDIEELEGVEAVNVLWHNGSIESCSIENLFEVKKCQTGI
tara:strand:- start:259 stop:525 length:267 start_codon:yes stop_codon:yes gene_type:complete